MSGSEDCCREYGNDTNHSRRKQYQTTKYNRCWKGRQRTTRSGRSWKETNWFGSKFYGISLNQFLAKIFFKICDWFFNVEERHIVEYRLVNPGGRGIASVTILHMKSFSWSITPF
mmetsp:Transcript_4490/g.6478  ORF Transcript_4490/g.6478 Transcript_4490/m.6478 type:complete len:115 (+) Transcript_4490:640-984(+)